MQKLYTPATTSGSVVVPTSLDIYSNQTGRVRGNGSDGYCVRWCNQMGSIHPSHPFALSDGSIETQGPSGGVSQSVSATSEAGIAGPDAAIRFGKVADPDDATKAAFIMRRREGDETTLKRTELSFSPNFTPVPLGKICWIAFAIRLPAVWKEADAEDEVMVFQVHETPDGGDDTQEAPIGMIAYGGGETAIQKMWVRSNPNATTLEGDTTYAEVWVDTDYAVDQWQYWVVELRSHWDPAYEPFIKAWRKVGASGTIQKVVDYTGPNAYNNTARDYVKSGLYYYDELWSGDQTEKVMYHKGIYQWLDSPYIDENILMDIITGI